MIHSKRGEFDVALAEELGQALRRGEICPVFQPKVTLPSGALAGVEALARWRHPSTGDIPPGIFIPVAERCGLIGQVTEHLIDAALRQVAAWDDLGLSVDLAVNISALNLDRIDFPDLVAALCGRHGVPPSRLTIELTESAAQQTVRLMDAMTRFRLKGMSISLDDFGTGYSSLAQLQQLPFTELKIDRCFVTDALRSRDSRVIVKSIIDLAHNLEMEVTAEGVESAEVLQLLVSLGCDRAQGYFIAEPMAGEDLSRWLTSRGLGRGKVAA